jgi:hypothetical protein
MMRTADKLAEDYIAVWNERDSTRRMELLAATWTAGATYSDPLMQGTGHAGIDGLIAAVQLRFPSFRFALTGNADGHGDAVRFSWALGPEVGEPVVKGTDFVRRDGDKIASVAGFLDLVPAAA